MFQDFRENSVVDYLLAGPPEENVLIQELYEKKYNKSLRSALGTNFIGRCGAVPRTRGKP